MLQAVTNEQFTKELAGILHRPAFFRVRCVLLLFIVQMGDGDDNVDADGKGKEMVVMVIHQ